MRRTGTALQMSVHKYLITSSYIRPLRLCSVLALSSNIRDSRQTTTYSCRKTCQEDDPPQACMSPAGVTVKMISILSSLFKCQPTPSTHMNGRGFILCRCVPCRCLSRYSKARPCHSAVYSPARSPTRVSKTTGVLTSVFPPCRPSLTVSPSRRRPRLTEQRTAAPLR